MPPNMYHRQAAETRTKQPVEKRHQLDLSDAEMQHIRALLEDDVAAGKIRLAEGGLPFGLMRSKVLLRKCQ